MQHFMFVSSAYVSHELRIATNGLLIHRPVNSVATSRRVDWCNVSESTAVTNYQSALRNIPEERRFQMNIKLVKYAGITEHFLASVFFLIYVF